MSTKNTKFTRHAESQIRDEDAAVLLIAALTSNEHRGSLRLVRGKAAGREEMLGQWAVESPSGPLHWVAVVRVIDGAPVGFDCTYTDRDDADAVYDHLRTEIDSPRDEDDAKT